MKLNSDNPFQPRLFDREWKSNWQNSSELRRHTQFGVCLWWSDELPCWIHPDDMEIAEKLVPGNRIFKRDECSNFADRKLGFSQFKYGRENFRALPAIWLPIPYEGFEIGDLAEVKSQLGRHRAMICKIREIRWNRHCRRIEYFIDSRANALSKPVLSGEMQPAMRLGGFLNDRQLSLAAKSRFV